MLHIHTFSCHQPCIILAIDCKFKLNTSKDKPASLGQTNSWCVSFDHSPYLFYWAVFVVVKHHNADHSEQEKSHMSVYIDFTSYAAETSFKLA